MNVRKAGRIAMVVAFALLVGISAGCGSSGGDAPSLQDIPRYPNATEG